MAAASDRELHFITLADFSPGIYDDYFSTATIDTPQGAAQLTGTYGCVSGKRGGLVAAPKRVNRVQDNMPGSSDDGSIHVTSMKIMSPMSDRTGTDVAACGILRDYPDIIGIGYEWFTSGVHHGKVRLYKMFKETGVNPSVGSVQTYDPVSTQSMSAHGTVRYGFTGCEISRSNKVDPTSPGWPYFATMFMSNQEVTSEQHKAYPSNSTPTTNSSDDMLGVQGSGGFAAYGLLAHQDRIFAIDRSVNSTDVGPQAELPTEILIGSAANDYSTIGVNFTQFVGENPSGFGSWFSANASELMIVKQMGGGFVVRGDVSNPTVIRLPGLASTFEAINIGCVAKNGMYVYGSTTGVHGFAGGDVSADLSPQLDGWFWAPGTNNTTGIGNYAANQVKGRFSAIEKYVFAPNNFMLNVETGGWWRLLQEGSVPYGFWDNSGGSFVVGTPVYFNSSQKVVADYYDLRQGQATFKWTGQPLQASRNRVLEFREISLIASGSGTVTVTLTGISGATDSATYTISSTRPVAIQAQVALQAHDVVVTIDSTSGSTTEAPQVHRVALGYQERMTARA